MLINRRGSLGSRQRPDPEGLLESQVDECGVVPLLNGAAALKERLI